MAARDRRDRATCRRACRSRTTASSSSATRAHSSPVADPIRRASIQRIDGRNSSRRLRRFRDSIGHRPEWIKACKDHKPEDAKAGFAYSGPYTEALLVGNLALRLQKRIEWDAANMRASNATEADELIHKRYRHGFDIGA